MWHNVRVCLKNGMLLRASLSVSPTQASFLAHQMRGFLVYVPHSIKISVSLMPSVIVPHLVAVGKQGTEI
jgi:hypothetical protein